MLKIYNQDNTFALEHQSTSLGGAYSSLDLCEQLANAFCAQFQRDFKGAHRVIVFAGPGANGAVALAIGRILSAFGHNVESVVLNPTGLLTDDCLINFRRMVDAGLAAREVTTSFNPPVIGARDIVIDGICGIDLAVPFEGDLAQVSRYINTKARVILAVDIPSGLMAEDNASNHLDNVIRATYTYTFHGPKLSFLLADTAQYVGEWKVVDIGLESSLPQGASGVRSFVFTASDFEGAIPPRKRHTHKYNYGKVALIAGSQGMMGAALLAGRSCMRSGVGHLTLHVPKGAEMMVHVALPEALVQSDKSAQYFTMFENAASYDAIAVGPGLGRQFDSAAALDGLLALYRKPLLIDADAIHILAANNDLLAKLPEDTIITPHAGELDALVGASSSDYERLMKAKELAIKYKIIIVLKGAYTATCSKNGNVVFNASGNPGMATAGTGDVLTGCMLALLGRGFRPLHAALFANYICGYAGDLYSQEYSQESLMASDVVANIPRVFKYFKSSDDFFGL